MKNKEAKSIFSSLENFSSIPPSELWDKIEAELEKPKKKKRPVIWWWVAAGLSIGLFLPTMIYVNSNPNNTFELNVHNNPNQVVLQKDIKVDENDKIKNSTNQEIIIKSEELKKDNLNVLNTDDKLSNKNFAPLINPNSVAISSGNLPEVKNVIKSPVSLVNKNAVVTAINPAVSLTNINSGKTTFSSANKNEVATTTSSGIYSKKINKQNFTNSNKEKTQNNGIVKTNITIAETPRTRSTDEVENTLERVNFNQDNKKIISNAKTSSIIVLKENKENTINENSKTIEIIQNIDNLKTNAKNAIAQNTNAKDSLATIKKEVEQLENALVELNKDKKNKKTATEVIDKWSLQVFAGVMSSENFTNEELLGNAVASKQSSGYGVKTNYKLNKKWTVSSGFKINELGQKIDGVSYYERGNSESMVSGILPSMENDVLRNSPSIATNIVFASNNENFLFASNSKAATGFETGNVTQNLKYFEMPLEISYAILTKNKTTINMNTGGFVGKLISNDVFLNGNSIGENKNVNEYVYGTLLSSTLQYEFYKKTKFFIEPGMNYYINPLQNQSFNQFQWIFNIGLNIAF